MKSEIFEKLVPYEEYLRQSMKDYMRVPSNKYREIADIYAEHFGKRLSASEMSCGRCQLRALKALAQDYFKYKDSPYYKGLLKAKEEQENGQSEGTEDSGEGK